MSVLLQCQIEKILLVLVLILCFMLPSEVLAVHLKGNLQEDINDIPFSLLILGDSQMTGAGWSGGYANCISETYSNARVFNLAQDGSLLANGEIHDQWEFYLSEDYPAVDFVLLDGGVNDLPYLQKEEWKDGGLTRVKEAFSSLVEQIHEMNPDTHIIYVLMPPLVEWKNSESGPPSYDIQKYYWKQMNILANSYDYVTVLDLFSLNPFRYPCVECYHENFADSIHLSEMGYRKTFEYLDNVFVSLLYHEFVD